MSAAVGDLVTVSTDAAIFLDYPKFKSFHLFSLIRILGGELKLAVWMQRNSKKYDKANITDKDIQRLFVHSVRLRIRVDFARLDSHTFGKLWCQGSPPLASVAGRVLTIHIDNG